MIEMDVLENFTWHRDIAVFGIDAERSSICDGGKSKY